MFPEEVGNEWDILSYWNKDWLLWLNLLLVDVKHAYHYLNILGN